MFIDSHCHLSFPELAQQNLPDILAAMRQAQVDEAICICTTMEEFPAVQHGWRRGMPSSGPRSACTLTPKACASPALEELIEKAQLPRVVAIGETGSTITGSTAAAWPTWSGSVSASHHIRAARAVGKPLVITPAPSSADTLTRARRSRR